jgi:hypothetical protein
MRQRIRRLVDGHPIATIAVWPIVAVLFVTTRGKFGYDTESETAPTPTAGTEVR